MARSNSTVKKTSPATGTCRIVAERNITDTYSFELEKTIQTNIEHASQGVVFDLTKITTIDSGGLALCIGLLKECQRRNLSLSFEVSAEIRKLFMFMKFDKILTLTDANRPG